MAGLGSNCNMSFVLSGGNWCADFFLSIWDLRTLKLVPIAGGPYDAEDIDRNRKIWVYLGFSLFTIIIIHKKGVLQILY